MKILPLTSVLYLQTSYAWKFVNQGNGIWYSYDKLGKKYGIFTDKEINDLKENMRFLTREEYENITE